ncbi:MAG: hypothetical protein AB7K63_18080 [Vicinamibacterales bacterium]
MGDEHATTAAPGELSMDAVRRAMAELGPGLGMAGMVVVPPGTRAKLEAAAEREAAGVQADVTRRFLGVDIVDGPGLPEDQAFLIDRERVFRETLAISADLSAPVSELTRSFYQFTLAAQKATRSIVHFLTLCETGGRIRGRGWWRRRSKRMVREAVADGRRARILEAAHARGDARRWRTAAQRRAR